MATMEEPFLFTNSLATIERIQKGRDNKTYKMMLPNETKSYLFIQSLYKLDISLKKIDETTDTLTYQFVCNSLEILPQYIIKNKNRLQYLDVLHCCLMVGDQMKFLEENGVSSPQINIQNILVINQSMFMYMNEDYIPIIDGFINIDELYEKYFLTSFDLFNVVSLPGSIHHNNWVSSLGLLGIYLLTNNEDLHNKSHQYYKDLIEMIQDTKLYFMLSRCLYKHYKERIYLYL